MEPLELEPLTQSRPIVPQARQMDELPPVRLVAVEDVRLPTPPGAEAALDAFYIDLLQFQREPAAPMVYRAENVRLRFYDVPEPLPVQRDSLRPLGIEVLSLATMRQKLFVAEIEYIRQRGLVPGQESLLVLDPAGNWVEIFESRLVM